MRRESSTCTLFKVHEEKNAILTLTVPRYASLALGEHFGITLTRARSSFRDGAAKGDEGARRTTVARNICNRRNINASCKGKGYKVD
jgi:hypothetical protein